MRYLNCFVLAALSTSVFAQGVSTGPRAAYPVKSVRIFAPEAGGSADFIARQIAQGAAASFGQPVVVENRPGPISIDTVVKSAPDGYTLLYLGSPVWLLPLLQKVSYDPINDFAPITLAASAPNVLVVHPSLPVHSVGELIKLAKAKPGVLNSSNVAGGFTQLASELFKSMANVDILQVAYKGSTPALTAVLSGEVDLTLAGATPVMPHVKAGRLRALGVTTIKPSALFPGVPTIAATGVPGYEAAALFAMFAPAKTPASVIERWNQEALKVLHAQDVKAKALGVGLETVGSTPEILSTAMKSEITRLSKIARRSE
jgi:tripartite-type tricarboxylate transporter receptor subunit TctC